MARFFLEISYCGTFFHGWQQQEKVRTVQQVIEEALTAILKAENVMGCGRTDTGVHASQFYLHFDSEIKVDDNTRYKLNKFLPWDVSVQRIIPVDEKAHARFDATLREYKYFIHRRKDPFKNLTSTFVNYDLDVEEMKKAAEILPKYVDFSSFARTGSDNKTTICAVFESKIEVGNDQVIYTISANRFLRNMVRAIAGTLMDVGKKKINIIEFQQIIEERDRSAAGKSAAPNGLFLTRVEYPYIRSL